MSSLALLSYTSSTLCRRCCFVEILPRSECVVFAMAEAGGAANDQIPIHGFLRRTARNQVMIAGFLVLCLEQTQD